MLENLLGKEGKRLNVNCAIACLMRDSEDLFGKYDNINLNCGIYIATSEVNAALLAKGSNINTGNTVVTDFQGEFVQVSDSVIDQSSGFEDKFVLIPGDVLLLKDGARAFEKAAEVVTGGTVYYPDCCSRELYAKIKGGSHSYPAGAYPFLGGRKLGALLEKVPEGVTEVWLSGELSAMDETALVKAQARGMHIVSDSLLTTESAYEKYRDIFETAHPTLVPDGFAITGPLILQGATSVLYGKKLYVRGSFTMEEKDVDCLKEFEAIIVKGCARLPVSCAKAFKEIGTADSYQIFEGHLYQTNGVETFSHDQLNTMVERGEKMTLQINGVALFAEDVTAEDIGAIAAVDCNGVLLVPGAAQGALSQRISSINGVTLNLETVKMMFGLSIPEILAKVVNTGAQGSNINTEIFMLK